jgi:hypothetical protein
MCRILQVSRSGFYAWRNRVPSNRKKRAGILIERIRCAHQASRGTYGSPRVTADLNAGV